MFYDQGCFGRVDLGSVPPETVARLSRVQGEWLEYDPTSSTIVVHHVEPTSAPPLPAVACELVRLFSEIPPEYHREIPGGDLFVHTEDERQLVRLRVEAGGTIHIQWAQPDFKKALRRPWDRGMEVSVDPEIQRLNGAVSFRAPDPAEAARRVQAAADTFEGLYPEGDFSAIVTSGGEVRVTLREVNLDASILTDLLLELAQPRTLTGRFEMSSFGTALPERRLRFLFEDGKVWVQHPLLWSDTTQ